MHLLGLGAQQATGIGLLVLVAVATMLNTLLPVPLAVSLADLLAEWRTPAGPSQAALRRAGPQCLRRDPVYAAQPAADRGAAAAGVELAAVLRSLGALPEDACSSLERSFREASGDRDARAGGPPAAAGGGSSTGGTALDYPSVIRRSDAVSYTVQLDGLLMVRLNDTAAPRPLYRVRLVGPQLLMARVADCGRGLHALVAAPHTAGTYAVEIFRVFADYVPQQGLPKKGSPLDFVALDTFRVDISLRANFDGKHWQAAAGPGADPGPELEAAAAASASSVMPGWRSDAPHELLQQLGATKTAKATHRLANTATTALRWARAGSPPVSPSGREPMDSDWASGAVSPTALQSCLACRSVCFFGDSHGRSLVSAVSLFLIDTALTVEQLTTVTYKHYFAAEGISYGGYYYGRAEDLRVLRRAEREQACTDVVIGFGHWPLSFMEGDMPWSVERYGAAVRTTAAALARWQQRDRDRSAAAARAAPAGAAPLPPPVRVWWMTTTAIPMLRDWRTDPADRGVDYRSDPTLAAYNDAALRAVQDARRATPPLRARVLNAWGVSLPLSDLTYDGTHYNETGLVAAGLVQEFARVVCGGADDDGT